MSKKFLLFFLRNGQDFLGILYEAHYVMYDIPYVPNVLFIYIYSEFLYENGQAF